MLGPLLAMVAAVGPACAASDELEPSGADPSLPRIEFCDPARGWPDALKTRERDLLAELDRVRAEGSGCGTRGSFEPAPPLARSGALSCAARVHSLDMATRDFVDHENPDDQTPWDRLRSTGYAFATADEVIANADLTPEDMLREIWLPRDGSCAALAASAYTEVGVGVASAAMAEGEDALDGSTWTIVVAKPIE